MKRYFYLGLSLCLFAACDTPSGIVTYDSSATSVVIQNVQIFPGHVTQLTAPMDVWIEDGKIRQIAPATTDTAIPPQATVIDGQGRTLLPGLIDVHTHSTGSARPIWDTGMPTPAVNLEKYLYAGITTIFDLGGGLSKMRSLQAELANGELVGPDFYYSGPHIGPKGGHPAALVDFLLPWPFDALLVPHMSFEVENATDAMNAAKEVVDDGASVVKVTIDELPLGVPVLDGASARKAVQVAHAAGKLAVAHVGTVENAMTAIRAGVDAMVHGIYREALTVGTAAQIAASGVPMAPTVGVFHTTDRLFHEGPEPWLEIEKQLMPAELRETLANRPDDVKTTDGLDRWSALNHEHRQTRFDNLAMMKQAGIPLLVGSDSAVGGWVPGGALQRELMYLVQGGYTPAEVLQAATYRNAQVFRLEDRGSIEVGKRADLLLVNGDPTQDIRATQAIHTVIRGGTLVKRREGGLGE